MCGIIAYLSKTKRADAGTSLMRQFEDQKDRGVQGFGLIKIENKKFSIERATEPTKALLDLYQSKIRAGIFHHRQPTSTPNKISQTHPIIVENKELKYDYLICHNGVISNARELRKKHTENLGYEYKTDTATRFTDYYEDFNDSEAFAIELTRYLENLSMELDIRGSAAFIAVKTDKKTKIPLTLIWGRDNKNPLNFRETKDNFLVASEIDLCPGEEVFTVSPNSISYLDLQKYFKTNQIQVKEEDLKIVPPPPPVAETRSFHFGYDYRNQLPSHIDRIHASDPVTDPTVQQTSFYDTQTKPSRAERRRQRRMKKLHHDEKYADAIYDGRTPYEDSLERELAFKRMSDRVAEDISEMIIDFFEDMAGIQAGKEELENKIIQLTSTIDEILSEKAENALTKIHPFFNRMEVKAMTIDDMTPAEKESFLRDTEDRMEFYERSQDSYPEEEWDNIVCDEDPFPGQDEHEPGSDQNKNEIPDPKTNFNGDRKNPAESANPASNMEMETKELRKLEGTASPREKNATAMPPANAGRGGWPKA